MSNGVRIQFALYLEGWVYDEANIKFLVDNSTKVTVSEHTLEMKEHLFCPECHVNLFRSPEQENFSRNGRQAFFAHSRRFSKECGLRTKRAEGLRFDTEEDAKLAVENDKLVIVSHFTHQQPSQPEGDAGVYDETAVEDQNGDLVNVPISRHRGESFLLPSKILTVRGITRRFDNNFYKYFFLPNSSHAILLSELLTNVENVSAEDDVPKLYYGKIRSSSSYGNGSNPNHLRKTTFYYSARYGVQDFALKLVSQDQAEKGINNDSVDKVVIMYGKVTGNGMGLCIERIGWGEFAVLPQKYEYLLYPEPEHAD